MNHDFDEEKCRETCDICWGDGGQQWPCAKAAGVCARSPGRQAAGSTPALVTSSAATPVVPRSGWKLVPIEPTKEMCIAAVKFANGNAVYKNVAPAALEIEEGIYGETYAAMLAASPSPRTPEQPEQRPDSDHPVGE